MRKILSVLVLAPTLAMLVGCGSPADTPPTETVGTAPTTVVTGSDNTPTAASTGMDTSLDAIKQRGKMIVGVKYDVPLFGFLNPDTNQVEGFDVDIARGIAKRVLGDEKAIEFKEAISKNRIPYLEQGVVDAVFSTMTANAERAQQIDFTDVYYVAGQSLLVPTDSSITSINDLAGKTVATVKGSTSEKNIRAKAPDAKVELFDTYAEAVQAMESGRADTVTTDDIILYGFQSKNPDKFKVVGGQFTTEPYAGGIKKGNTALLDAVDGAIRDMKQNGEWATIYKKWIPGDTVPPPPPQSWQDVGGGSGTQATPTPKP